MGILVPRTPRRRGRTRWRRSSRSKTGPLFTGRLLFLRSSRCLVSQHAGSEDQDLHPLREGRRRVAVEGVEVVEERLQVGVTARVVEDGNSRGVLGLGGDDVPDVQPLGGFGLGGPEKRTRGLWPGAPRWYDPSDRAGGYVQVVRVQHLVPPVGCELPLQPRVRLSEPLTRGSGSSPRSGSGRSCRPPRIGFRQRGTLGEDPARSRLSTRLRVSAVASTRIRELQSVCAARGGPHLAGTHEVRRRPGSRRTASPGQLVVRIPGSRSSSIPTSLPTNSGRATLFMRPMARRFDPEGPRAARPPRSTRRDFEVRSSPSHRRSILPSNPSRGP